MVLVQPFEVLIILGAALGAFVIAQPGPVLKQTLGMFGILMKGSRYNKAAYIELLGLQFSLFKLVQIEGHPRARAAYREPARVDDLQRLPEIRRQPPRRDLHVRLPPDGDAGHQQRAPAGDLMDEELETHHQENERLVSAIQALADGTPALGIVAAVLGVIHTMGSISQPPEVLGHLIGGALVGTFLGVLISYGFFGPFAQSLKNTFEAEAKYFLSMKTGLLAHISGNPPVMAIEFARKMLMSEDRPTFAEVDEATQGLPALT